MFHQYRNQFVRPNGFSYFTPNNTEVKLKELPFYQVLHVLVPPSCLVSDANAFYQEKQLCFRLNTKQAQEIAASQMANGQYECQVQLRFCLMDTLSEQTDIFPPNLSVKINNKSVSLPNTIEVNQKRLSKPINITSQIMRSITVIPNVISVTWFATEGRAYVGAVYVVRKLCSYQLLQSLSSRVRNAFFTIVMVKNQLQREQASEISSTELRSSLLCPIGKIKMQMPCRAVTCNHIQCFDADTYLQMNEKKPKWVCPICDKPAPFKSLAIDGLFSEILTSVPLECTEVKFSEDGSWSPIEEEKTAEIHHKKEPGNGSCMAVKEKKPAKAHKKTKAQTSKDYSWLLKENKPVQTHPKKKEPVELIDLSDSDSEQPKSCNKNSKKTSVAGAVNKSHPLAASLSATLDKSLVDQSGPVQDFIQAKINAFVSELMTSLSNLNVADTDPSLASTSSSSSSSLSGSDTLPNVPLPVTELKEDEKDKLLDVVLLD